MQIDSTPLSDKELVKIVKQDLKNLAKWASQQTKNTSGIRWTEISQKAQDILQKIQAAEEQLRQDQNFSARLRQHVSTQNRHLNEIRHAQTLQIYLTQGYIFLKEVKKMLTGENIEYLILFDDGKKAKLGVYSLEDLLPTLALAVNVDGSFTLQIKRAEELQKLKRKKGHLNETGQHIASQIIKLHHQLLAENRRITQLRRQRRAKRAGDPNWSKQTGYLRGQAGRSYEVAANKVAEKVLQGISNHSLELISSAKDDFDQYTESLFGKNVVQRIAAQEFKADTQAFYKAGDLIAEATKLFVDAKNVVLELKRVSTSENTVGAPLASQAVIQHGLQRIIDIIGSNSSDEEIYKNLQEMFSSREKEIDTAIQTSVDKKLKEIDADLSIK